MLPLYAFSPSTPSQHCTHAVTFPSETITCASYATQNAWCVNRSHTFASNSNFGSQEVLSLDPSLGASLDSSFSP